MNTNMLNLFLSGAITMQYIIAALFFLRYRTKTKDNFFIFFAGAFALLATERVVWLIMGMASEIQPVVYLFRLCAFLVIVVAVLMKNRQEF
jgi:hypothetical protein